MPQATDQMPKNTELTQALMQAAFMTAGEAILSINSASNIMMANPEIENVFGYTVEELIGEPLQIIIPEKYRAAHIEGLQRYLRTGVPKVLGLRVELEGLKKDGSIFPLEIQIDSTLLDGERFFTAVMRDISKKKEQQRLLKEQQAELEQQNHRLARSNHFFLFTLDTMETVLQQGTDVEELFQYIKQARITFDRLE